MLTRTIKELVLKNKFSKIFDGDISESRAGFNEGDDVDTLMQRREKRKRGRINHF